MTTRNRNRMVITLEWTGDSYDCQIKGHGDIRFSGRGGDDLAMNVGRAIKRWAKFQEERRTEIARELGGAP